VGAVRSVTPVHVSRRVAVQIFGCARRISLAAGQLVRAQRRELQGQKQALPHVPLKVLLAVA
jgi:hypothetical protein